MYCIKCGLALNGAKSYCQHCRQDMGCALQFCRQAEQQTACELLDSVAQLRRRNVLIELLAAFSAIALWIVKDTLVSYVCIIFTGLILLLSVFGKLKVDENLPVCAECAKRYFLRTSVREEADAWFFIDKWRNFGSGNIIIDLVTVMLFFLVIIFSCPAAGLLIASEINNYSLFDVLAAAGLCLLGYGIYRQFLSCVLLSAIIAASAMIILKVTDSNFARGDELAIFGIAVFVYVKAAREVLYENMRKKRLAK